MLNARTDQPARKPSATLDRALSRLGVLSRTQAALAIADGRVTVNGRVARDPARWVDLAHDQLALDGLNLGAQAPVYLMMNKPRGLICTRHDERGRGTVMQLLGPHAQAGVMPVGRLDAASEGLLLLSNDTRWTAQITDPASQLHKRYHVQIGKPLDEQSIESLRVGVHDAELGLLSATAARALRGGEKTQWLEIVLNEGKNRQIRRMLTALDREVLRLIRVAIGPLELGDLAKSSVRPLASFEVAALAAAQRVTPAQSARDQGRVNAP